MRRIISTVTSATTSNPLPVSGQNGQFALGIGVVVSGTLTYTVEHTFDDPEATYATDFATDAAWFATTGLSALTASDEGNIAFPVSAVRLDVTAFTSGDATITILAAN